MRTLVIEDDAPLRSLLRRGLAEEGFSVDVAANGEDGLHLATREAYDAIVLDLMIPGLPGLTVLARLRQNGRDTPVLILTARDAPQEKVRGLDAGADDWMTKPFTFAELTARLRALIRRTHRVSTSVVRVADLVVDTAARRVERGGQSVELRAKEYAILEVLALRHGQVVTRQELHDHVWAHDSETVSNAVDVHVCRLRTALDRDGAPPLIHTVRGQGYVLREA
jgi:DNA-binding response OmpR family regulator